MFRRGGNLNVYREGRECILSVIQAGLPFEERRSEWMGRRRIEGGGKKRELQSGQEKGNDFMLNVCLVTSTKTFSLVKDH